MELAARPELLLFLDEPTSGLDSDTAWAICTLLRKLADHGQAILCTIHQPSATLFEMFDALLFLANGQSLYFGEIGHDAEALIKYFEGRGARMCGAAENPAEWLLDVTGGVTVAAKADVIDWAKEWQNSAERREVKRSLVRMKKALDSIEITSKPTAASQEFAASFIDQLYLVTKRTMERDWLTPEFLYSRFFLIVGMVRITVPHLADSCSGPSLESVRTHHVNVRLD